jgi:hypothetical protein
LFSFINPNLIELQFDFSFHSPSVIHDFLQYEAAQGKNNGPGVQAFKPYLVWMMRNAYWAAPDDKKKETAVALLKLWVERKILSEGN